MHTIEFNIFQGIAAPESSDQVKQPLKKCYCPASWEEITKRQLIQLARYYSFRKMNAQDEFKIVYQWSAIPLKVLHEISTAEIFGLIRFIYEDCALFASKYKWHSILCGPQNFLKNFTMDQFGMSQVVFKNYMDSGDKKLLDTLAAICYVPFFMSFRSWLIGPLQFYFRHFVSYKRKMAMCINIAALRNEVMNQHPHVFPKYERDPEDKASLLGIEKPKYDWEHTTLMLAGERFGPLHVVRKAKVIPVLKYCEMMAIENSKKKRRK